MKDTKSTKHDKQSEEVQGSVAEQQELEAVVEELSNQVVSLSQQLSDAKRREQVALADYQNLVRRTSEERSKVAKLAAKNFVEDLIQPLNHLSLASEQLNDAGLNMVITQLWQALEQNGLKKIDALGKPFDVTLMEASEIGEKGETVVKVISEGYTLNNEVIQHAKVILD